MIGAPRGAGQGSGSAGARLSRRDGKVTGTPVREGTAPLPLNTL